MLEWLLDIGSYLIGMGLAFVVACALVTWGLFADRSKGRARCPRCWYDMRGRREGAEGLVCPECGHDARNERRLYKDRRRWRAVCIGLAIALPNAYMLSVAAGWYREQQAIARISRRMDSYAGYRGCGVYGKPFWPSWFRQRLPIGLAGLSDRVRKADLAWDTFTDADLKDCGKLTYLEEIRLDHSSITDTGLRHIIKLRRVHTMDLSFTGVTDEGLAHVGRVQALETLRLRQTKVTDEGLKHLCGLDRLEFLELKQTEVTDRSLTHLRNLKSLRWLYFPSSNRSQTEAAVAELKESLPQLDIVIGGR